MFPSEQSLAAVVVAWLCDLGWDVYQEVQMHTYSSRCDIVARRGPVIYAIECKLSLGLAVLDQAHTWRGHANYISVAVPSARSPSGLRIAGLLGVGVLFVSPYTDAVAVRERVPSLFARRRSNALANALCEAHKHAAPAGSGGGHHTPFRATCNSVRDLVRDYPGSSLREVMSAIKHHYLSASSARGAMAKWIREGKVPGVVIRRDGRTPRLYPHPTEDHDDHQT